MAGLTDTDTSIGLNQGDLLWYNNTLGKWVNIDFDYVLESLINVTLTGATINDVLTYDGSSWINQAVPVINALNDIADVNATLTNGHRLYWNNTEWNSKTFEINDDPVVNLTYTDGYKPKVVTGTLETVDDTLLELNDVDITGVI